MTRTITLQWVGGGEARIIETDGFHAKLHSTRQAAPGTPLHATIPLESGTTLRFKVRQCSRVDESTFQLLGRWVDLPKAMREEMLAVQES